MTQRNVFDDLGLDPVGSPPSDDGSDENIKPESVDIEDLPLQVREDIAVSRSQFERGEFVSLREVKALFRRKAF